MHMHFLFIKSKAADPPSLIESSPWRLLSGAQVSSKKQHVHMNATNGHMFEGVDPRPVPPPHPPLCDRRATNHFGEIMGPKKKRYEIIFKKRFRNIKAVVFCMCCFFSCFFFFSFSSRSREPRNSSAASQKPRGHWDLDTTSVTQDRLDTTGQAGHNSTGREVGPTQPPVSQTLYSLWVLYDRRGQLER